MIETEKLILKTISFEDAEFVKILYNQKSYLDWIGDRLVDNIDRAKEEIRNYHKNSEEYGGANYIITRKSDNKKIGSCGIMRRTDSGSYDLSFSFLESEQSKGYGYEAVSKLLYIYQTLYRHKYSVITARAKKENFKSIGLLEKLGFEFIKELRGPSGFYEYKSYEKRIK